MKKLNVTALIVILLSVITAIASTSIVLNTVLAIIIASALSYLSISVILKVPQEIEGIPCIPNNSIFG